MKDSHPLLSAETESGNSVSGERSPLLGSTALVLTLVASVLIGVYPHFRYNGHLFGGGDAARFTNWIRSMQTHSSLVHDAGMYPNGYAYQALVLLSNHISGLELANIQLYLGTLLIAWTVFMAWLFYRQITQSNIAGTFATVLILIQPELLFGLLRGTHEKFTRGLMFLALYLLIHSILSRRRWRFFVAFLLLFYLVIYALITFNTLLAISFITALGLSLVLSLIVQRLGGFTADDSIATRRRLLYAVSISLILAFFFTFYAYTPARQSILVVQSTVDRIAIMFLGAEEVATNPYGTVLVAWINLPVYLIVSVANWLLLAISFVLWLAQTLKWWQERSWPAEPQAILLWSLYGAFGFLGAASIIADVSGAIAANLQHRFFPSFAMIAAPLVADWFVRRQALRPVVGRLAYAILAIGVAFLGIVAVTKATNEPSLSNKWVYYVPAEFTALGWARTANPDTPTWTAFDERLRAAIDSCCGWESEGTLLDSSLAEPGTRLYLISDVIRARSERLRQPLPIEGDSMRVYDNGDAQFYRLRPQTPFQK